MSNLEEHARRELTRIGEEPEVIDWYCRVIAEYSTIGHSGGSAEIAAEILYSLLKYEPLSELTDDPEEWEDQTEISGYPVWQNIRDSRAMSKDGGKTYWRVDVQDGTFRPFYRSKPARDLPKT